ncbi:MAG TPA: beta-propeller domain-containing protein [Deltaproteobacteria bacterium]|nr:beta-propeller domain-containing protein [Deltaproteobacteria bacterium]HQJ07583.1 beta-propeller domain-containing protein [Deltaproteobacteria bacterium]
MSGHSLSSKEGFLFLLIAVGFLFSSGCSGSSGSDSGSKAPGAAPSLESYLKEQYASAAVQWVSNGQGGEKADVGSSGMASIQAEPEGSAFEFTTTNLQERGVDESDKVKTDGTYLYTASGSCLVIVKLAPGDGMEIASSTVLGGAVDSLYLNGKTAAVLYQPAGSPAPHLADDRIAIGCPSWIPSGAKSGIALLDVSDPSRPAVIKDIVLDGTLVSSRSVGGMLRLVLQFVPYLPPLESTYDGTAEDHARKVAANLERLKDLTMEDLTPSCRMTGEDGSGAQDRPLVSDDDYYLPGKPCGGSILGIVSIDLNDPSSPFTSTGIVADVQAVYASEESLFVTNTHPQGSLPASDFSLETTVLKFDITGPKAVFKAAGTVPGSIVSQFSLSEYEGVLRIAATRGYAWDRTAQNSVYCLKEQNGSLETVGLIEDIAPGEQVYAVRFMGPHGYVVTFVQIDPLFTLDLSDPTNPRIAGELKVPGYSTYLHPLGDDCILAIGKDAVTSSGTTWYQGLRLSIFGIGTFDSPKLLHAEGIGDRGTDSEALSNYRAFTYWSEKGLLAIPVYLCEHQGTPEHPYSYGTHTFTGLYVYRVSPQSGFSFLGRIPSPSCKGYDLWSYGSWTRGLFIGDSVYSVDGMSVSSALTDDITSTIAALLLGA